MQPGIVEGFYGKPWTWEERINYADFIRSINFDFYIYAPKADKYLRENWKEPFPLNEARKLEQLSGIYHKKGIKWGAGLSLFNAYISFDSSVKLKIKEKLNELSSLNPDIIAVLFDDMRGDTENIAETQVGIVHFILENAGRSKIIFCPTYYSFDSILDDFFGQRPRDYLEYIGDNLDPGVDIIWTGPKVRSESITVEHLEKMYEILKRKPFIWDNYIANDGKEHRKHLYIKPFKNRERDILKHIAGFMVNPMNQAYLSRIPLLTAADELGTKCLSAPQYNPENSIKEAVRKICGNRYADRVCDYTKDFLAGVNAVPERRKTEMEKFFSSIKEKWALEILEWLKA